MPNVTSPDVASTRPGSVVTSTGHKKTADELENALALLDAKLAMLDLAGPIEIKAIGGFALLKHKIRDDDRAYTVDIDTVTRDYEKRVVQAIEEVGEEAFLDKDWLNNYNVLDNDAEHVEFMIGAEWIPQDMGLKNIQVAIATVPTLTRAKIIASDSAEFSGRLQDVPDLIELLEHQKIQTMRSFDDLYPDPFGEYPDARTWVSDHFTRQAQMARQLSGVLPHVSERAASTRTTARTAAPVTKLTSRLHARFPELDGVTLDPYGLSAVNDDAGLGLLERDQSSAGHEDADEREM